MLSDDGDIVRGLGFVSMYSAWVEEDVDDILRAMAPVESFEEEKQRWQISKKLRHAAKLVERLGSSEVSQLPEALRQGISLFEERNMVVHGRIYAGHSKAVFLQSGRASVPTREITSAELYKLANEFWEYRGNLIGPQVFRLPRAISAYVESVAP